MEQVLRLDGLVKRYGSTLAVGPVDITVGKGEFLTLLGPSGCGKTTTLHIIAGLTQPTEGRLTLAGRDVTDLPPPYRDIGLVFQNYALFPHKTIAENVAFGLRMRKVPRPEIDRRVREMLAIVGLPGVEDRRPHQLSGGQRQRVALARALVIEPSILLLDEPLSNLDAQLRKRMRLELRDIQKRLGITAVFVTHDQDEAFEMSDRVVLMNAGRIEQVGSPDELYDRPRTRFAAEFIGEASLLKGRVESTDGEDVMIAVGSGFRAQARSVGGPLAPGDHCLLLVRPERVALSQDPLPGDLPMQVAKRVFQGDRVLLELTTQDGQALHCSVPSLSSFRDIAPGRKVGARLLECRAIPADPA